MNWFGLIRFCCVAPIVCVHYICFVSRAYTFWTTWIRLKLVEKCVDLVLLLWKQQILRKSPWNWRNYIVIAFNESLTKWKFSGPFLSQSIWSWREHFDIFFLSFSTISLMMVNLKINLLDSHTSMFIFYCHVANVCVPLVHLLNWTHLLTRKKYVSPSFSRWNNTNQMVEEM